MSEQTQAVAPAKPPKPVKPFVPHDEFVSLKQYIANADPQDMVLALRIADSPRFAALRGMIKTGKGYDKWDLSELCKEAGLKLSDIVSAYTSFMTMKGKAAMATHLPAVMETTAKDAISRPDVCPRCDGDKEVDITDSEGNIVNRKPCPKCKGTGEIVVPGIESARKLVFEAHGLTGRNAPLVAQQFNVNVTESFEDSVAFTQGLLEGE